MVLLTIGFNNYIYIYVYVNIELILCILNNKTIICDKYIYILYYVYVYI